MSPDELLAFLNTLPQDVVNEAVIRWLEQLPEIQCAPLDDHEIMLVEALVASFDGQKPGKSN